MIGVGVRLGAGPWSVGDGIGTGSGVGTGSGAGNGAVLASLTATPTTRWHPEFSTITEAGGRVTHAADLMGLADVNEGAAGIGPKVMTDARGRKFWRFEGAEYLDVAAGLVSDSRDISVFVVGRVPRILPQATRFLSLGSRNQGTQRNTLNGPLEARLYANSMGHLQSFSKLAYTAPTGGEHMVPGAQLQVMGAATSANGTRLILNDQGADVGTPFNATGIIGGEIGRYAWSTGNSGTWAQFDLYEMVVFSPGLDPVTAAQVSQDLMAAHGVVPVVNQLILEGDSITQGVFDVTPALSSGAVLTEPGMGRIAQDWRVINKASSGNRVSHLVTKREANNGWATQVLAGGRNVMAFEIGRNDWGSETVASHYANVVAYLTAPVAGVLPRGWDVRVMINIATGSSLMPQTLAYRDMLRDPQFLVDCNAGPGQPYNGMLRVIATDLIEDQGQTVFQSTTDAQDPTYYANDGTHPTILGTQLRMTGGETPEHGVAWGL